MNSKPRNKEAQAKKRVDLLTPADGQTSKSYIMTKEEITAIADRVSANISGNTKEVLTSEEAARYMGFSRSHLYKLTMRREIPHFKPTGKYVYFSRAELDQWMQNNRIATVDEARGQAEAYCRRGGVR